MDAPSLEAEPCVVLDVETTGGGGLVIELAVVGLRSGATLLHTRYGLPSGAKWNPMAEQIHGITQASLRGLPTCRDACATILALTRGRKLIGHNLATDVAALVRSTGCALEEAQRLCTLKLAQQHLPGLRSYKLGDLARTLGVSVAGRHHAALVDTLLAREVYLAIRERALAARGGG